MADLTTFTPSNDVVAVTPLKTVYTTDPTGTGRVLKLATVNSSTGAPMDAAFARGQINGGDIEDGAVTPAKLSDLSTSATGVLQIMENPSSGDATRFTTGKVTGSDLSITTSTTATNLNSAHLIGNNTNDLTEYTNLVAQTDNIANSAVTTAKIANRAVTAAKLASDVSMGTKLHRLVFHTPTVEAGASYEIDVYNVVSNDTTYSDYAQYVGNQVGVFVMSSGNITANTHRFNNQPYINVFNNKSTASDIYVSYVFSEESNLLGTITIES